MEILRPEQQVMQAALLVRSARAELLAGNVANADTPGYLARDLKFDDALEQAVKSGGSTGTSFDVVTAPANLNLDHNDIDVSEQLAKSFDNSGDYVATLKLYGDSMGRLETATSST